MLRIGARWRDCPEVYGPYTTVYNRFNRWSRQGIWTDIFYALTGSTGHVWVGISRQPFPFRLNRNGALNS